MIEAFVIAICIQTTPPACESAATSYYKHSGVEELVSKKGSLYATKYPNTAHLVAYTAAAAQGRIILGAGNGKYLTLDKNKNTIGIGWEF